jgi:sigma-B regulation protein RsbU (phosphoserine phosphatase)
MFTESRDHVRTDTLGKARQTLDGTVLHIDNTLRAVEVAANNMLRVIEDNLDKPDKMFDYSRQVLESNPNLDGCSISFEPFYYKEKGEYFSAYSYNNGDSIETENEGADYYQYHTMDWYLIPKLLNRPYWIEPYQEDAEWGIVVQDIFSSYSQPIHDKTGKVVGTFSVDICLDWFSDTVSATKPFPNSYTILLGKGGTFLVHPDSTRQFYETVFTSSLKDADPVLESLGEAMIAGESGYRTMTINGELSHVFFKPFKNTGWSVAIICPESDIYASYYQLRTAVQWIGGIGLLLMLVFCFVVIRNRLRPLRQLAKVTQQIARGEFANDIPDSRRSDEIGQLQHSFKTMQQSLGRYVQEVRHETEVQEQQNRELQAAYQQVKEEEHVKDAVLHRMSDKMAAPVKDITAIAKIICEQHQQMADDVITAQVNRLLEHTTDVTSLLDKLLDAAQKEGSRLEEQIKPDEPYE